MQNRNLGVGQQQTHRYAIQSPASSLPKMPKTNAQSRDHPKTKPQKQKNRPGAALLLQRGSRPRQSSTRQSTALALHWPLERATGTTKITTANP
jgi:hypothetical protein